MHWGLPHYAALVVAILGATAEAATVNIGGTIKRAGGYTVHLVARDGTTQVATVKGNGRFTLKGIRKAQLKGASLQLVDANGRYAGPIVLAGKKSRVATTFSGKLPGRRNLNIGRVLLKNAYARLQNPALAASLVGKSNVEARQGKPVGAGEQGLVRTRTSALDVPDLVLPSAAAAAETETSVGGDADLDGLPDSFDADDDGDLVLDATDPDASGGDVPYATLYLDFRKTINANVRTGLSDAAIRDIISGENVFALATWLSLPPERTDVVTGGHIVCADALTYCRPNTPVAFFGGVTESSSEFKNRYWSELLTADGYPRLEKINMSPGAAFVAAIQPRVGPGEIRPGDVFRAVLTGPAGVVETRTFTVSPYFVSVPALKSYDAGSGTTTVQYADVSPSGGSIPGASPGDPIVLSPAGTMTLTFWRPQRAALRSDESGYYDWGQLHYGVTVGDLQASCAGLFTQSSDDLVEDAAALGTGGTFRFNQGAKRSPLRDSQIDRAAAAENTLTFTVDLKTCYERVNGSGSASGTRMVGVYAEGESLTGGSNSTAQFFYVQFPGSS